MHISASTHLTAQMVSSSSRRAADGDGDGLTGAAALNDGDAASIRARATVAVPRATGPATTAPHAPEPGRLVDVRA